MSEGRVRDGTLECPYHGWRFARDGVCVLTPGSADPARHGAEALPALARAGLVWTTLNPNPPPFPALPRPVDEAGYDTFLWAVRPSSARLIDAVENLLDPAHPHFLHSGIVRTDAARRPVEVTVRTTPCHAEAVYLEEAKPSGLLPRLLEGKRGVSIGRFFPPAVGQVAFETEGKLRLAITVFFTPESPQSVRPFAHFATPRGRAPAFLKEWVLRAFHLPILGQDRAALAAQRANIERFGAPKYALGPLDFLLPAIQRLSNGEVLDPSEQTFEVAL